MNSGLKVVYRCRRQCHPEASVSPRRHPCSHRNNLSAANYSLEEARFSPVRTNKVVTRTSRIAHHTVAKTGRCSYVTNRTSRSRQDRTLLVRHESHIKLPTTHDVTRTSRFAHQAAPRQNVAHTSPSRITQRP